MSSRLHGVWKGEERRFRTGRLCLDFAHTGGEGRRRRFELLGTPEDLRDWLASCSLELEDATVLDAEMPAARRLREAIWQGAQRVMAGTTPRQRDVATLNRFAAVAPLAPVLALVEPARRWAAPATAPAALSTIARDAIDLFSGPAAGRIRVCASRDCGLLFFDDSRSGTRRWCSMSRCGNRAKVGRYRTRRATTSDTH